MRLPALFLAALPLVLGACASSAPRQDGFVQPNSLMSSEIDSRIQQIPYQHREELLQNMMWLAQTGEQTIPALLKGLKHENAKVRSSCAWTLGQIGDRRVIPELKVAANDTSEPVRLEVARTLVTLGDLSYCPKLIEGLDADNKAVRFLCHEALKGVTGRDFGFDHLSEDKVARHTAVLGWRQWWGEYSSDPWFAQSYAQQHGLPSTPVPPVAAPMGEVQVTPLQPAPKAAGTEAKAVEPEQIIEFTPAPKPKPDGQDGR